MAEEHAAAYIESAEEFQETLASNAVVVVDFTASWCGPCQMIAPIYEDMAKANQAIKFVKVDVDKLDDVAAQCGVSCMPTFQFFVGGEKKDELQGASKDALAAKVAKYTPA